MAKREEVLLRRWDIALIKGMLERGDAQHHIAAFFGINQGAISRINTDHKPGYPKLFIDIGRAQPSDLPVPGPYLSGRSATRAREALLRVSKEVDEALSYINRSELDRPSDDPMKEGAV